MAEDEARQAAFVAGYECHIPHEPNRSAGSIAALIARYPPDLAGAARLGWAAAVEDHAKTDGDAG